MSSNLDDDVLRSFWENISSITPPPDATLPSRRNGQCIPQRRYGKGVIRGSLLHQDLVVFILEDGSYLPVNAALAEDYTGLILWDVPTLGGSGNTITLRMEWPGYPPAEFQLRTFDWCAIPSKIPLAKLATEVSKLVRKFVEKAQGHNIAPGEAQWKVGPGGIEVKDLRLASLEQVTAGTWQVRLFYKPTE